MELASCVSNDTALENMMQISFIIIIIITSSGDLQPSTAIANQLPGQLVYTQITTRGPNCFKFIMALIMPSRNII